MLPVELVHAWDVFLIFVIPFGGGIPVGVLVGHEKGLSWPELSAIYFVSDLALAVVFELLLIGIVAWARHSQGARLWLQAMRQAFHKTLSSYGVNPGPFALVLISFGVDPMTGRTAARAARHGFVTGWMIAITGDMFFFWVLLASTLWLNGILGNGTWTAVIIMTAMFLIPYLIRRFRERQRA
jgi:hypothetical protein